MKTLFLLTDYNNKFGSKWNATPYRSGLDKAYLANLFESHGYKITCLPLCSVDFSRQQWKDATVLYTSSEEHGLYYKNFIEDVVFGLKECGARLLPDPLLLRANNNKVFMEVLRKIKLPSSLQTLNAQIFGSFNELIDSIKNNQITLPCVIKTAAGAMSRGVFLAKSKKQLLRQAKKISKSAGLRIRAKEYVRKVRHHGYRPESAYQQKFIVQPFIPNLQNDWKVLIYGNKVFVLKRNIKNNDFRASGSGYNYTSGSEADFPNDMLDFVRDFYLHLDVPNLSLDFAYDGVNPYVFEFQAIHYGTSTHYKSQDYFELENDTWVLKPNDLDQEQLFVYSIIHFLNR